MRILIVSEVFAPVVSGVAVTTARLATRLAARGHVVQVLTASQESGLPAQETCDGYQVVRVSSVANPFRKGFRLTVLARRAVARAFDEFGPEIVHIQDPISLSVQAAGEAKRRGIPVVATHHFLPDYVFSYLPDLQGIRNLAGFWLRRRLMRLYAKCAAVTVPTETVRRVLVGTDLQTPVSVISNGVDTARFKPEIEKSSPPIILYVGRLDPEKNLPVLLKGCAKLKLPYRLVMIGGGNLVESLKKRAERLGVQVEWVPSIETGSDRLPKAYQEATVFCMPSPHETESMVTLEAMASGLPILAADGGALPELVEDGKNGYLLAPDRAEVWKGALEKILLDTDSRLVMGAESRRRAGERDVTASVDAMEKLYEAWLAQGVL